MLVDKTIEITPNTTQITGNRVRTHHFGISGNIKKIEWIFKTTISENFGMHTSHFDPVQKNWYNYISFSYPTDKFGIISLQGGADTSNINDTIIGGGLSYKYVF